MVDQALHIVDDDGVVVAQLELSHAMRGVSLRFAGIWHSAALLDQYVAHLTTLSAELKAQQLAESSPSNAP